MRRSTPPSDCPTARRRGAIPAASSCWLNAALGSARTELGPAVLERPKAKKIRQTAALQCFLLVAFGGHFDEKLRGGCSNGLCERRRPTCREKRATDLRNDFDRI